MGFDVILRGVGWRALVPGWRTIGRSGYPLLGDLHVAFSMFLWGAVLLFALWSLVTFRSPMCLVGSWLSCVVGHNEITCLKVPYVTLCNSSLAEISVTA
jgi:hypothetical protein